jgi:hypothetical protein
VALLPPIFQQNNQYSARVTRQLIDDVATEGVVGVGHFAVTERAAGAAMSVEVAAGRAYIVGDDQANQGTYLCISEATEELPVAAADSTDPRIDLVVAEVRDPNAGGVSGDDWQFRVIEGTPGVSPVAPAVPDSAIPLAEIDVAANVTSILDADITDLRTFGGKPLPKGVSFTSGTGAPWNIPFPVPGDSVGADAIKDLAEATADGLSAAGGLVAVKHALFTGTQSQSVAGQANFAVTNLSITHALADAGNKLIISAYFGAAGTTQSSGDLGIAVADDGTLIGIGTSPGNRTAVGAGGNVDQAGGDLVVTMPSVMFVYEPGDTNEHTYTVRAITIGGATRTIFINRAENDADGADRPRASSGLVIQEVKV